MNLLILSAVIIVVLAGIYYSRRYAWWKQAVDYKQPRILMYHMICEPIKGAKFNSLRVSPAMFEKQLAYMSQNGWYFFTVSALVRE